MYNNEMFIEQFKNKIKEINPRKVFFVCSSEYDRYGYRSALDEAGFESVAFTGFEPCPEISSVKNGVELIRKENCDFMVAVGGGSAIDTAKGIKYYLESDIEILAVPTTAGTGAEVTRFSVLYSNGDKESVNSFDIIPEYQIFDHTTLASLPRFQRIVTSLDALCHSIEALWSVSATDESRAYSIESIDLFNKYFKSYLDDDKSTYEPMMKCSELGGRAINIARTTAPHAMSYKLHKLKGFAHGQAVAICLGYIWKYTKETFDSPEIASMLEQTEKITGFTPDSFISFLNDLGLCTDFEMTPAQFDETVNGVNVERMNNHNVRFNHEDINNIYSSFLKIV